jgi:hypothetical protein
VFKKVFGSWFLLAGKSCFGLIFFFSISCKKDPVEQTELWFWSESNDRLTIDLFPTSKYGEGKYYPSSYLGGSSSDRRVVLDSNSKSQKIFESLGQDKSPSILLGSVFDSIVIRFHSGQSSIKFSRDTVIGYPFNPFHSDSAWNKRTIEYTRLSSSGKEEIESEEFTIFINEE